MKKIVSLEEKFKRSVLLEFNNICSELKEENIQVDISEEQFKMIIDEFYQYYASKSILYFFIDTMKGQII